MGDPTHGKGFMKRIATLTAAIALMLPGSALAATNSSTCQAYNPQTCFVTDSPSANTPATTAANTTTNSSATLPFTGMDVGLIAVGGATLVGGGLVLRRFTRREN